MSAIHIFGDEVGWFHQNKDLVRQPWRAPYHTANREALLSELALSATGTLVLDEADELRETALGLLLRTWLRMAANARPTLLISVSPGLRGERIVDQIVALRAGAIDDGEAAFDVHDGRKAAA